MTTRKLLNLTFMIFRVIMNIPYSGSSNIVVSFLAPIPTYAVLLSSYLAFYLHLCHILCTCAHYPPVVVTNRVATRRCLSFPFLLIVLFRILVEEAT